MSVLDSGIEILKGVGPAKQKLLAKLGIRTVDDLLRYFPTGYEDWVSLSSIFESPLDETVCIRGTITSDGVSAHAKTGKVIVKSSFSDGECDCNLIFFNNRYVVPKLKEGREYLFRGKISTDYYGTLCMISPALLPPESVNSYRPVYHLTEGISSAQIAAVMRAALDGISPVLPETLPDYLIKKYRLMPLPQAFEAIHFPKSAEDISQARRRFVFEELLIFELAVFLMKSSRGEAPGMRFAESYFSDFEKLLPFKMTGAQRRAVLAAEQDMLSGKRMNRLLQGDVGSGKTAVAAALLYTAVKNGFQGALMAPTEVLAAQHAQTLSRFFENTGISVGLLTGSVTAAQKRHIKEKLRDGDIQVIVGTHALIQSDVVFNSLGLVITDEQHRFGVSQRAALGGKGDAPHVLVMSATPIPRTLAMMVYGDLDVSVLDELPPGRTPIKTYSVDTSYRKRIYAFLRKNIDSGRQGYIICPLVEEGESDLVPAKEYKEYLEKNEFPGYNIGLIHGRMKPSEKDEVMRGFSSGELDLIVSTTVVEVGVDVPNATVMMIENAERFGLSTLHQLRGRIGRGKYESFCILVSDAQNKEAAERMKILCDTTDGFKIADEDLRMRGPGDFFGKRQSGLPALRVANILTDTVILSAAQKIAGDILTLDPTLSSAENELLNTAVEALLRRSSEG